MEWLEGGGGLSCPGRNYYDGVGECPVSISIPLAVWASVLSLGTIVAGKEGAVLG